MKEGFWKRLSDVIAWVGFGSMILLAYTINGSGIAKSFDAVIVSATAWLFFGVVNYLISGSLRLLPWRDVEDQE